MNTQTNSQQTEGAVAVRSGDLFCARPDNDNRQWENQCARCGSSMTYVDCTNCGGEGVTDHDCGEDCCCCLHPEDNVPCDICDGEGGWWQCISSPEYCEAHPIPGRETVKRGAVEWYPIEAQNDQALRLADASQSATKKGKP